MIRWISRFALGILLIAWRCFAAPLPDTEPDLIKQFQISPEMKIEYRDERGQSIDFDRFHAVIVTGRGFKLTKDDRTAKFQLGTSIPRPTTLKDIAPTMPSVDLRALDGKTYNLGRPGKPTLVSFYFAECSPCVAEIPVLNAFMQKHRETGVVAVTFDTAEEGRTFVRQRGLNWPVVADADTYIKKLGVTNYPTLLYLDKNGRALGVRSGGETGNLNAEEGLQKLERWIAGLTPSTKD